jgi:HD-like signal output (HDOD) protein
MPSNPASIQQFFEHSQQLPTLPEVARNLLGTLGRDEVSLSEVVALVAQDSALAARLLRLANSARYRPLQRISRLQDAAALIGLAPLRSLALGACLAQAFPHVTGFDRLRFWRLNLATAGYARWLAGRLGHDSDRAEVAGLLLRCGELLMLMADPERSALVQALAGPPDSVFALQQQHFGCNHAELSAELAVRWHFPTALVDALFTASDPMGWQPVSVEGAVLRIASLLAEAAEMQLDPLVALQQHQPRLVRCLGLDLVALAPQLPGFGGLTAAVADLLH